MRKVFYEIPLPPDRYYAQMEMWRNTTQVNCVHTVGDFRTDSQGRQHLQTRGVRTAGRGARAQGKMGYRVYFDFDADAGILIARFRRRPALTVYGLFSGLFAALALTALLLGGGHDTEGAVLVLGMAALLVGADILWFRLSLHHVDRLMHTGLQGRRRRSFVRGQR